MKTCPPGTSTRNARSPHCPKNAASCCLSPLLRTVNRGKGWRDAAVQSWWDAPDATPSAPEFVLFLGGVLFQAVGGVGDNGMDAVRGAVLHPREAILLDELI